VARREQLACRGDLLDVVAAKRCVREDLGNVLRAGGGGQVIRVFDDAEHGFDLGRGLRVVLIVRSIFTSDNGNYVM
jgi:hypothetical protein